MKKLCPALIICLMCVCSCCKIQLCSFSMIQQGRGLMQLERSYAIPTFESEEIFYDGLPNLPRCGDIIVAHTTIYDGGFQYEDNRLCALNLQSGDIEWYFPADPAVRSCCHFDGKGYAYNDRVVFQYSENWDGEPFSDMHRTVCLDAENGEIIWERDGVSEMDSINKDVVGEGSDCFFVQGSNLICKVDMSSDVVETFFDADSLHVDGLSLCGDYLIVSCSIRLHNEQFEQENYCIILDKGTAEMVIPPVYIGVATVRCHGLIEDGILYANMDRYISAIDIRNGEKLWERYDEWAYILVDMYVYKDVLLKCAVNATVGYDKRTGEILYDFQNYGSWFTTVHKGYAYLLNRKDNLDVFDVLTGKKMDHVVCPDGGDFFGSYPMVYDEKLYIIGGNKLYRYPIYPWQ